MAEGEEMEERPTQLEEVKVETPEEAVKEETKALTDATDQAVGGDDGEKVEKEKAEGEGDGVEEGDDEELDEAIKASMTKVKEKYMPKEKTTFYEKYIEDLSQKGPASNIVTFFVMILGIILSSALYDVETNAHRWTKFILGFGLFGFAGGVTNWLAVKMLFDKVPGLVGSGVIPNRFKEIRQTVKDVIMLTFFDPAFLEKYLAQKAGQLVGSFNVEDKIKQMLESPVVDKLIDDKLGEFMQRPEGMWMTMMGLSPQSLKPMIKPFILGMGSDVAPLMVSLVDPKKVVNIERIRSEIDSLMTEKLEELSPAIVKEMMERVIREHLGWLIVWGCVFGGLIGIITEIVYLASGQ